MTSLELLAPARNADIGIEAIRHGADAVYIGAHSFGARHAAGNSLDDISRLVVYAHQFKAKVYVTVNTIIYEEELPEVEALIHRLYDIGVDALIVQDMSISRMDIPPIPLHASTQMDNRSAEKVEMLSSLGYEQVVLARELTLDEISEIHRRCPSTKLEVFVHGALCVSLSGRCYASQALSGRSANRGECAQICRMAFNLEDGHGNVLVRDKNLLSLKDLCRIDCLEDLIKSGVTSFKIEGRLKEMDYVKNVTSAYSQALDKIISKYPGVYERASKGVVRHAFTPDVYKSFNRGFTNYFLYGENDGIFSIDTPKATGKAVGRIKEVYTDSFVVDTGAHKDIKFANGDGLCFFNQHGELIGMRINRAEGNRLYPFKSQRQLRRGTKVFRNYDKRFVETLQGKSSERNIIVSMTLSHDAGVFTLSMYDGEYTLSRSFSFDAELARTPQRENIYRQLSRLGNTPFILENLDIRYKENYFIPSSVLSLWRREVIDAYLEESEMEMRAKRGQRLFNIPDILSNDENAGYQFNVANSKSRDFYLSCGFKSVTPAFELQPSEGVALMTCRHCIKYALGMCSKNTNANPKAIPHELYLVMKNGTRLQLKFNCRDCVMTVVKG